jgi:hypothetical protein
MSRTKKKGVGANFENFRAIFTQKAIEVLTKETAVRKSVSI